VQTGDVLVVEDDADIRESLVEILMEEGYVARGFANGAEALAFLRSGGAASVILLDLMMPVMDGREFRLELEKDATFSSIPVILLTADNNPRRKAATLGAVGGLGKPVRLDDLLSTVEQYYRPKQ